MSTSRTRRQALRAAVAMAGSAGCLADAAGATASAGTDRPTVPLAASARQALDAGLRAIVDDAARPLPSLGVIAVRDGQPVYEAHFGRRSIEQGLPADEHTLYRVASISKLVVAIAVMQLVERGHLDLEADVGPLLGGTLRHPAHPGQPITARMLLTHTSSLRDPGDLIGYGGAPTLLAALGHADARRSFWSTRAGQAPQDRHFHYANVNTVVLATLIERLSGQRFDRHMRREVLEPLRLRGGWHPATDLAPADWTHLATLYRKREPDGTVWDAQGPWHPQGPDRTGIAPVPVAAAQAEAIGRNAGHFGPQGGLRLDVRGLATLMRLLMNGGEVDGVRLLQPASVARLLAPQWTFNGRDDAPNGDPMGGQFLAWGLGLQQFTDQGGRPGWGDRLGAADGGLVGWGHLGNAWGLRAILAFDPARRAGMAVVMGGTGADPEAHPGRWSGFTTWEEAIASLLWQQVLRPGA